jgi:hypothetical protein
MTDRLYLGTVRLPPLAAGRDEVLWPAMLDLAAAVPQPWTLIGGQMVHLHGALAGRSPHRFTEDIDVVFDMRVEVDAIAKADRALARLGYEVTGVSADGPAYRYRNGRGVEVDILAPDHLGSRALSKLHTPHGKTVQVPGARKALEHSCSVTAIYGEREEELFVPSLLTATNIKLKAIGLPGPTERIGSRHLDDIAFLVSCRGESWANTPRTASPHGTCCVKVRRARPGPSQPNTLPVLHPLPRTGHHVAPGCWRQEWAFATIAQRRGALLIPMRRRQRPA